METKTILKLLRQLEQNSFVWGNDYDYIAREIIFKIKDDELGNLKKEFEKLKSKKFRTKEEFDDFRKFMIVRLEDYLASS